MQQMKERILKMKIQDIKIFPWFENTKPSEEKIREKEAQFQNTGLLPSVITLNDQNWLLDGYVSYLLAVVHGLKDVPVRYERRQVIRAYHKRDGKRYDWELPERLIDQVAAGDKILIRNARGLRWVIVEAVEEYGEHEYHDSLKMVVSKKNVKKQEEQL